MLKAYAHEFVKLELRLASETFSIISQAGDDDSVLIPQAERDRLCKQYLEPLLERCQELGLKAALGKINYMLSCQEWEFRWTCQSFDEIRELVSIGLKSCQFLYVEKTEYYDQESLFGEKVYDVFPNGADHIREAGTCFALERWNATVFHCRGIMQAGLFRLGKNIGSEKIDLLVDDWKTALKKVHEAIDRKERQAASKQQQGDHIAWNRWKRREASYGELISDLKAVQRAWRSPTAHFRRNYGPAEAGKVLDRVRDFMQHSARLISTR